MIKKVITSVAWSAGTVFLFYTMRRLENIPGEHIYFVAARVLFMVSLIMQILVAIGFVKMGDK